MNKPVYVLGGGGHGRVVVDTLLASGALVAGILDASLDRSTTIFGVPVLGGDECLDQMDPHVVLLANGLGANPDVRARATLFSRLTARGFAFVEVRHPSVTTGSECRTEAGSQLMAGVVLQHRVCVRANAVINTRATVDHGCDIERHAFVGPGATLCGSVKVSEFAFIGAGAIILPGVVIGDRAVVGAGAVIRRDVRAESVVIGNPARQIGE